MDATLDQAKTEILQEFMAMYVSSSVENDDAIEKGKNFLMFQLIVELRMLRLDINANCHNIGAILQGAGR